jgi:hypothetical protein
VAQVEGPAVGVNTSDPGDEVLGRGAGEVRGVRRDLGDGEVPGGIGEGAEVSVGDLVAVEGDGVHRHLVDRCLLGVVTVRSHRERAARERHDVTPEGLGSVRRAHLPWASDRRR